MTNNRRKEICRSVGAAVTSTCHLSGKPSPDDDKKPFGYLKPADDCPSSTAQPEMDRLREESAWRMSLSARTIMSIEYINGLVASGILAQGRGQCSAQDAFDICQALRMKGIAL